MEIWPQVKKCLVHSFPKSRLIKLAVHWLLMLCKLVVSIWIMINKGQRNTVFEESGFPPCWELPTSQEMKGNLLSWERKWCHKAKVNIGLVNDGNLWKACVTEDYFLLRWYNHCCKIVILFKLLPTYHLCDVNQLKPRQNFKICLSWLLSCSAYMHPRSFHTVAN